jgi:hypothetical protein
LEYAGNRLTLLRFEEFGEFNGILRIKTALRLQNARKAYDTHYTPLWLVHTLLARQIPIDGVPADISPLFF